MKLTIGMIVKNEEKYLDRCLSAIKPILDSVDSELIITDTGSTDKTVEIAKKYTDKVLHFDWINDFSAARNTGIENAHGEWFMFLDADEIFQSCDGIISFFNSGEYNKYNSATYTVRNLGSNGGYSDFEARRMTKIFPETRFNGVIHEHLSTFKTPTKYISNIADHYGYVFNDVAERVGKFERNYQLLQKKYEQIKDKNPMIYAEMYDTLATGFKQKEADEYLEKGIEWCIKNEHPLLILMYCKKARHLLFEKQNNATLEVCEAYFGMSKNIRNATLISDAEILTIKATVLYRQENWSNAAETLAAFFPVYDDIKSGKLNTKDKMYGSLSLANDKNYLSYVGQFLVCCLNSEKYDFALNTLKKLPISKYSNDRDTLDSIIQLETSLLQTVGIHNLDSLCNKLDEYGKKALTEASKKMSSKTNSGKVTLTIGMIVKNEEKYLDRCLSAIKPILDNVDSELIITDTGSTDRTVEIARKYTDKVLHFDWINDFAAARNFGLEKAQGEWFMFVDADDVFTDCEELISFFNSDESNQFGSASFTYRNIRSMDKSDYIDQYVIRIVRRLPQTRFVGRIHEVLDPMPDPIKALGTVVEHYGYFYDCNNDSGAKAKRNERILLKELEDTSANDAKSVLLYYYLYQEIRDIDSTKAEQYLDEGEEKALKLKSNAIIPIVHEQMRLQLTRQEYDAAIISCEKYFRLDTDIRSGEICADTEVYAVKALALSALGRYEESIEAFDEFFRLFDLVKSEKLATGDKYIYLPTLSGDSNLSNMIVRYVRCCNKAGRTDIIEKYLKESLIIKYLDQNGKIGLFPIYAPLMKDNLDISPVLFGIHDVTVISASLCCDNIDGFYNTASKYDPAKIKEQEKLPEAALFYEMCINKALKNNVNANDLIRRFIEIGNSYAGEEGNSSIKLSRIISKADSYRMNGAYRECITVLKNALSDNPDSAILIKGYIDIVSKELNASPTTSGSSEMEKLAITVKINIRQLIGVGDLAAAGKLLDDYSKINPGDPEINELKQLL